MSDDPDAYARRYPHRSRSWARVYESRKRSKGSKIHVDSCFAPKDVYEVVDQFMLDQRAAIVDIGLGEMLNVDNFTHMDREFSWDLLLNTDVERSALKIEDGVYVTFNEIDIHNILGTSVGGDI